MYYAVKMIDGKKVNMVFPKWEGMGGCEEVVKYHQCVYKGFRTRIEANQFLEKGTQELDTSEMTKENEIHGEYMRTVFENESDGYVVALYKITNGEEVVCVGYNLPKDKTVSCVFQGEFKRGKYGWNFMVSSMQEIRKETKDSIVAYLSCGAFKGIGEKTAERIYAKFGKETYRIFDEEPERLMEVKGITKKKYATIMACYEEKKGLREITTFLIERGISPRFGAKLANQYGSDTLELIKKNPYLLCNMEGITFETADAVAKEMNIPADTKERFNACVLSVLKDDEANGNSGMELNQLQEKVFSIMNNRGDGILNNSNAEWVRMLQEKELLVRKLDINGEGVKTYIFPKKLFQIEQESSKNLTKLAGFTPPQTDIDAYIKEAEEEAGIELDDVQKEAIISCLNAGVSIITGGPGVGKTTIIRCINSIYEKMYPYKERIYLAPTGRASRRMTESIGEDASTIHHYLKLGINTGKEESDVEIEDSLVVIDEFSMVDMRLFYKLSKAICHGCQLVLVGDIDQLPSVGVGRVLQDIIESNLVPVVKLLRIYRQSNDDVICENANKINNGDTDIREGRDFKIHEISDANEIEKVMAELVVERVKEYGLGNVMCLCPYKKGAAGVISMNNILQEMLNPEEIGKSECKANGIIIREGDLVMQIARNTDDASNGDIGIVKHIYKEYGKPSIEVLINGVQVLYEGEDLELLTLAYATTVHKSQGSEAEAVVFCLSDFHYGMKYRNIPYVAVSRGRKIVDFVGSMNAMKEAINNKKQTQRVSLFGRFLKMAAGDFVYC